MIKDQTTYLFPSVLLIEDEPAHALIIKRAVRELCAEVSDVNNVAAGLESIKLNAPALIITDLHLPDNQGLRHISQLRAAAPQTPLIVLTSSTLLQDAVEAMKLGARDYLVKNFDHNFRETVILALTRLYTTLLIEKEREQYKSQMEALRVAIENGSDAMAVTNVNGQLLYHNTAFAIVISKMGGATTHVKDWFGDKVDKVQNLKQNLLEHLSSLSTGAGWSTEIGIKGEKDHAYDLSMSAIKGGLAAHEYVFWLKDISEHKRRERFQRDMLSTTTHDLKGPLGAILISVDLLEESQNINQRDKDLVLRIGSSARGVLSLIDEFLSARRIKEGTFILKPTPQPLQPILQDLINDYHTVAASRNVQLQLECEDLTINGDKLGLTRVFGNLLSNALKFTPKGGKVTLAAKASVEGVAVMVKDTGCGMEPSELKKIFERFSRLEKHRDIAGTGLGLFVVKSIVSAHGGKIEVISKIGEGTTFTVFIPKDPPVNERGELISLDFT